MTRAVNDATLQKAGDIYQYLIALRDCFELNDGDTLQIETRNSWITSSLSSLFSCSSVYLNAITRTPCLFITGSDYSRFPALSLIRLFCRFGIMTVDNTSEKLLFNGSSDVLSTSTERFFSIRSVLAVRLWISIPFWQLSTARSCLAFF